jgi:hypothetical protein
MTQHLGPYQLVEQIGAGGMGVVHRAYDIQPNGDAPPASPITSVK